MLAGGWMFGWEARQVPRGLSLCPVAAVRVWAGVCPCVHVAHCKLQPYTSRLLKSTSALPPGHSHTAHPTCML